MKNNSKVRDVRSLTIRFNISEMVYSSAIGHVPKQARKSLISHHW